MNRHILASAIMPTMPQRAGFRAAALACLRAQTHSPIELIEDDQPGTIGEKRNRCCARAQGEFIVHWDDDDWSAPRRISEQLHWIQAMKVDVLALEGVLFHDGKSWYRYQERSGCVGSSLCYRRDWWMAHPFDDRMIAEDQSFAGVARAANRYGVIYASDMLVARVHHSNTSKKQLHAGSSFRRLNAVDVPDGYAYAG